MSKEPKRKRPAHKPAPPVKQRGKPGPKRTVTPDIQVEICKRIAEGRSLLRVSQDKDLPGKNAIYAELARNAEFGTAIVRARTLQADGEYDEFRDVLTDVKEGRMDPTAGKVVLWGLTWRLAHMNPKLYGEKLDVEHGGSVTVKRIDFSKS